MKKITTICACVFLLALTLTVFGDDKEKISNALKKLSEATNYSTSFDVSISSPDMEMSLTFSMERDGDDMHVKSSAMGMDMEAYKIGEQTVTKGMDGTWQKGENFGMMMPGADTKDMFKYDEEALAGLKEIKIEGEETVDSVKCAVYSFAIDIDSLAKVFGSGEIPAGDDFSDKIKSSKMQIYIGKDDSLPRKIIGEIEVKGSLFQAPMQPGDDSDTDSEDVITKVSVTVSITDYDKTKITVPDEVKNLLEE